jgi:AraC-like DNA-binding protein
MAFPTRTLAAFDTFRQSLRAVCGNFETRPSTQHNQFIGDIHAHCIGPLETAHIRTNAGLIARERVGVDGEDDRHCFLIFQRSGRQCIRQRGVELELHAGDFALVDSALPFEIRPQGLIENVSVHLARQRVMEHFQGQQPFGRLARNSLSSRMIRALVGSIGDSAGTLDPSADGQALQDALLALLVPALAERVEALPEHTGDLYGVALQLIGESLQDAELSPALLAERLHISVRRLYRLFEDQGESVCRYIQRARLDKVAQDLSAQVLRHESITQIAFKWGFFDAAHFSRAFKRQFELSPRDYRARAHCA